MSCSAILNRDALAGGTVPIDAERSRAGDREAGRDAARPAADRDRLRHSSGGERQHDARGQGGDDLSRPRPARFRAARVRRQWRRACASSWRASLQIRRVIVPPARRRVQRDRPARSPMSSSTLAQALALAHAPRCDLDKVEQRFRDAARRRSPGSSAHAREERRLHARGRPALRRPGVRTDRAGRRTASSTRRRWPSSSACSSGSTRRTYGHAFRGTYADRDRHAARHRLASPPGARASQRAHAGRACRPERPRARSISVPSTASATRRSSRATRSAEELRAGPLIIEEYEGTTVVPPDCAARLDERGNIVIEVALERVTEQACAATTSIPSCSRCSRTASTRSPTRWRSC